PTLCYLWDDTAAEDFGRLRSNAQQLHAWVWGLKHTHKINLEVVEHTGKGFRVVPHRWVVERTFACLLNYRRHRCDYEVLSANSEAIIQTSMIHLLLKQLG